jgi:hypothetical protein
MIRIHLARRIIKLRTAQRAGPVHRQPPVDALDVLHVHAHRQPPHHLPFVHRAETHRALRAAAASIGVTGVSKGRQGLYGERLVPSSVTLSEPVRLPPPAAPEHEDCDEEGGQGEDEQEYAHGNGQCPRRRAGGRLAAAWNSTAHDCHRLTRNRNYKMKCAACKD